jgi:hypothetical protein
MARARFRALSPRGVHQAAEIVSLCLPAFVQLIPKNDHLLAKPLDLSQCDHDGLPNFAWSVLGINRSLAAVTPQRCRVADDERCPGGYGLVCSADEAVIGAREVTSRMTSARFSEANRFETVSSQDRVREIRPATSRESLR